MTYRVLSHTADTGIEASAPTLSALISALATGMFGVMAAVDPCRSDRTVSVEVQANTVEDLVVDVLAELLYRSEVADLIFCVFDVSTDDRPGVHIEAKGVPVGDVELTGPPIKAVTYHDVVVRESDEGWYGRIYFDV